MSIVRSVPIPPVQASPPAESTSRPAALVSSESLPTIWGDANGSLELQNALQLVQELLIVSTGASGVAIALGDAAAMQCVSSVGYAPPVGIALQLGNTLSGQCVSTGQIVRFQRRPHNSELTAGPCSAVLAPIFLHGYVAGLVGIFSGDVEAFGNGSTSAIRHAASLVGLSMSKIQDTRDLALPSEIGWAAAPTRSTPPLNDASALSEVNNPAPVRRLLGAPCPNCRSYLLSGERVCSACRTTI